MADTDDLPSVFDPDVVARVADAEGVPRDRLVALLAEHQAGIRELPGVEDLVYEWRRQFDATVIETTEAAYYVATAPWVWEEFGESLDASEAEGTAMTEVHDRHVRARTDVDRNAAERALVVLDRTA